MNDYTVAVKTVLPVHGLLMLILDKFLVQVSLYNGYH